MTDKEKKEKGKWADTTDGPVFIPKIETDKETPKLTPHEKAWMENSKEANKALKGKKIKGARYLTKEEHKSWGWFNAGLLIELEDGSCLIAQSDDEGNDAGVIVHIHKGGKSEQVFHVL